jgi:hypothetical protein
LTPVCDEVIHECVICTEHDQCSPEACNLFTGACVAGPVVTVGPTQTHATLAAAVGAVVASGGTIIVYQNTYNEVPVTINGSVVIAFLANGSDRPIWQRTMGSDLPQLRVSGGSTVLMDGIDLRANNAITQPALRVDDSSFLWVDRGIIAQNAEVAVEAESAAYLVLRNCFVSGPNNIHALSIMSSEATIRYSTIGAGYATATAVTCGAGSTVTVSDSIILSHGAGAEVVCAGLTANNTAAIMMLPGMDNIQVDPDLIDSWFLDYDNGDFHLTKPGQMMFEEVAQWNAVAPIYEPLVDIDGEPRAGVDMPEHAGADLP